MTFKTEQVICHGNFYTTDCFNIWLNLFQTFEGNDNNYQVKKNILQPGVVAILILLRLTKWYDKPCVRLEVYGEPDLERGNCYCCMGMLVLWKYYSIAQKYTQHTCAKQTLPSERKNVLRRFLRTPGPTWAGCLASCEYNGTADVARYIYL